MFKSLFTAALAAGFLLSTPLSARAGDDQHENMQHEMSENDDGDSNGMMGCPMMQGMKGGMQKGGGMMMHDAGMMAKMTEKRLAAIKSELKITDTQTEAWNGYVTAVKARGDAMKENRESMMKAMKEGTAISRLDTHIAAMEKMLGALKALKPATEKLYSALDDGQKKIADKSLGHGCMM